MKKQTHAINRNQKRDGWGTEEETVWWEKKYFDCVLRDK